MKPILPTCPILLLTAALLLPETVPAQSTFTAGDNHYAWGANTGWIDFFPQRPGPGDGVQVTDTHFSGFAWSANTGWINLQTGILRTETMVVADTDGDRISDAWELELAGDLDILRDSHDSDGDGISDLAEYLADTDPLDPGDRFRIIDLALDPSGTRVTWISRPTRLYRVHQSVDLQSWTPSLLGLIMPETGPSTQRLVPHPTTPRQFFRVESIVPLQP